MNTSKTMLRAAYALTALGSVAVLGQAAAFAQDMTKIDPRTGKPVLTTAQPGSPARSGGAVPAVRTAREEAAKTAPSYDAFGASGTESVEETWVRLSRDFASTSEVGVRRLGYVPVWPRGEIKVGPFRLLPFLRQGIEYESNFFETRGRKSSNQAAWTHQNNIGAKGDAAFMGGRLRIALGVDAEWDVRYGQESGAADEQADGFEFEGTVAASYRFESGISIRGGVSYERRADPIDVEITREFQRTNRKTFLTVAFDRDILFGSKAKFEVGTSVRDSIGREDGLDGLDRTETSYFAKVSYPFWKETTRLFGRVRYRQDERESQAINDGNVWGFDAGLEGTIPLSEGEGRGIRGSLSIGFDKGLYEDDEFPIRGTKTRFISDENDDNGTVNITGAIEYRMSRKTTFTTRIMRSNQFSFRGNYQTINRLDLSARHMVNPGFAVHVQSYIEYSDPAGRVAPQVVGARGDTTSEYPGVTRGGIGAGFRYSINDWMDFDFQYDYERRNHRFTGFTNHRASAGLTFYMNALKPRASSASAAAAQ